jgi:thiamine-phosphate pyrophosphorylase
MFLYAITDSRQLSSDLSGRTSALLRLAEGWALGGVDAIQIREKDLQAGDLEALTVKVLRVVEGSSTKVFVNGRVDVAMATGAEVHLPVGGMHPSEVVKAFAAAGMSEPSISVSCHSISDVLRASEEGAGIALLAPIFGKQIATEGGVSSGLGLDILRQACCIRSAGNKLLVIALGGVNTANAHLCTDAGATGIAGIRLFLTDEWRKLKRV